MKKILTVSIFFLLGTRQVSAQDDVYDAPEPAKVQISSSYGSDVANQNQYQEDDYNYNLTYSNRLRRLYNSYSYNYTPYSVPMAMNGGYWGNSFSNSFALSMGNYGYNPYLYSNYWGMPYYGYSYMPFFSGFYNDYFYRPYYGNYYPTYINPYTYYSNSNMPGVYRNTNPRPNNNVNGNSNYYGGSYSPPPSQTTPRGFGRYDNTYRQSPAKPIPNYNPQSSNPGPQNQNNRGNIDYSPNINLNSGNSFPGNSRPANNNSGTPRMNRF